MCDGEEMRSLSKRVSEGGREKREELNVRVKFCLILPQKMCGVCVCVSV